MLYRNARCAAPVSKFTTLLSGLQRGRFSIRIVLVGAGVGMKVQDKQKPNRRIVYTQRYFAGQITACEPRKSE